MDDKLRLHVSRNRKAPRLETTDAENMIMTLPLLRDKVESWKASNSGSEVPVPGSSVWVTQIVGAVITDFQRRKGKFAVLFHNEPSMKLLTQMEGLQAFRGRYIVPVPILHEALAGPSRNTAAICQTGSVSGPACVVACAEALCRCSPCFSNVASPAWSCCRVRCRW